MKKDRKKELINEHNERIRRQYEKYEAWAAQCGKEAIITAMISGACVFGATDIIFSTNAEDILDKILKCVSGGISSVGTAFFIIKSIIDLIEMNNYHKMSLELRNKKYYDEDIELENIKENDETYHL